MKPKAPLLKVSGKVSNFPLADFCFCFVCGLIGLSLLSGLKQKWIQCLWLVQRQHRRRQYIYKSDPEFLKPKHSCSQAKIRNMGGFAIGCLLPSENASSFTYQIHTNSFTFRKWGRRSVEVCMDSAESGAGGWDREMYPQWRGADAALWCQGRWNHIKITWKFMRSIHVCNSFLELKGNISRRAILLGLCRSRNDSCEIFWCWDMRLTSPSDWWWIDEWLWFDQLKLNDVSLCLAHLHSLAWNLQGSPTGPVPPNRRVNDQKSD